MKSFRSAVFSAVLTVSTITFGQVGGGYADLHAFGGKITYANRKSGLDGCFPQTNVTFDGAGNMYGTTAEGGAYDGGTVWEITPSGTYKDLHDFGGQIPNSSGTSVPDGNFPTAGVTVDKSGNLYGTTRQGGPNELGIVWKLTTSGKYTDLHDFGGTVTNANGTTGPDGRSPYASVTLDRAGNIYGTAPNGGPNQIGASGTYAGMVWEITTSGAYKDLHDFGGTVTNAGGTNGKDGVSPFGSVAFDGAGSMYGVTSAGGPNENGGMLWVITPAGTYRDLHDFGGMVTNAAGTTGPDGSFPWSVSIDGAGDLVGLTNTGGPYGEGSGGYGMLWEMTSSGTYRDLHDFGGTVTNANGKSGPDGWSPYGAAAFDTAGNIYGSAAVGGANDSGILWVVTPSETYLDLHDFGGTVKNANGKSGADGMNPGGGVAFDKTGKMYGTAVAGGPNIKPDTDRTCGIVWSLAYGSSVESLSLSPASLLGGATSTATLILSHPAPSGGTVVPLSANSASVTVPASVFVAAGFTKVKFTVTTIAVDTQTVAAIRAGIGNGTKTADLTIRAPSLAAMTLDPTSVTGGAVSTGTVNLSSPAGPGGVTIKLSSSSQSASVAAYVTVSAGSTTATFAIESQAVTVKTHSTIKATLGTASKTAVLTISP